MQYLKMIEVQNPLLPEVNRKHFPGTVPVISEHSVCQAFDLVQFLISHLLSPLQGKSG